jgi:hypothetical protein
MLMPGSVYQSRGKSSLQTRGQMAQVSSAAQISVASEHHHGAPALRPSERLPIAVEYFTLWEALGEALHLDMT